MQTVSSRIWTRVDESISYDSNHYTTAPPCIHMEKQKLISKSTWIWCMNIKFDYEKSMKSIIFLNTLILYIDNYKQQYT